VETKNESVKKHKTELNSLESAQKIAKQLQYVATFGRHIYLTEGKSGGSEIGPMR
jgi:hypothetical protein